METDNKISLFKEVLPLVTLTYILFSVSVTCSYYTVFNIDILSFVDAFDILYSPARLLPYVVVLLCLVSYIVFAWKSDIADSLVFKIVTTLGAAIIILVIIIDTLLKVYYSQLDPTFLVLFLTSVAAPLFFYFSFFRPGKLKNPTNPRALFLGSIFIVILEMAMLVLTSNQYAMFLKTSPKVRHVRYQFTYKHVPINSSSSVFVIGQTHSNLFMYSRDDSSTRVYKMADVDSLIIRPDNR